MHNTVLRLACLCSVLLFSTAPVSAAEKKTVFNTESLKYESGTGVERCRDKCGRRSGTDVQALLAQGWNIVSSAPKEVIAEQYRYVPCNTCKPHGCVCIGTEYVLQRDEPAPGTEAKSNAGAVPAKDVPVVVQPVGTATATNELDLLKKENDSLKRENVFLKQENEDLKNQLKSIRK
jgi:hypothetical protein